MSLRAWLAAAIGLLAFLTLAAAISLVVLTSVLDRSTHTLRNSVEGVRLAEEVEVGLLSHERLIREGLPSVPMGTGRASREELEDTLRPQLVELRDIAATEAERALLEEVSRDIDLYLARQRELARVGASGLVPSLDAALNGLEQVIEINVAEAQAARAQAVRSNRMADIVGFSLGALLLVGAGVVFVLLRRIALQPLGDISEAMRRFGSGRKRARAPESGPTELRDMARTFNEMANSLAHQQEQQLAFLAGVAHELRNPLSALKLSTALTGRGRVPLTPERMERTLALVNRQVERLDRMVGDLLDATRIEAGKLELRPEVRDARELASEVMELYRSGDSGHVLQLSLPDAPVLVHADPARVEQVLHNLVSNALKYSPAGSRVDVAVRREAGEVLLSVADQGIGISEAEMRLLFAPFQRTGNARQRAPGVGLGLSVARRIVEAHGGHIEVDSRPGVGSTFRVHLPLASLEARPPEELPGASGPMTPSGTLH
ncbi:HAMP domain-containing histidine kinase [Pyxidicoccus fallax]|uniref:histidine kinase n=1 Tax=Pyxidicoccus fallax TaxID=394095 RepID=A0A848LJW6_9BACT|nr:HAMP domain-containing sensor histidine kinase [Pyxidicoccus fallax]NMO18000.1 HAMP domain-containing histidine kinase [Pyxidicoccus fallax]NPC79513.1 HAMP domain-containing histidine kinase [Pyxidicoccus fallax]